jgi:hypothetical protein
LLDEDRESAYNGESNPDPRRDFHHSFHASLSSSHPGLTPSSR